MTLFNNHLPPNVIYILHRYRYSNFCNLIQQSALVYEVNCWTLRKNNWWSWLIHTIRKMCINVCVRTICGRCVNSVRLYYSNKSYWDPIYLWEWVCIKYVIENRSMAPYKPEELNNSNKNSTAPMFFFVGVKMAESGQIKG